MRRCTCGGLDLHHPSCPVSTSTCRLCGHGEGRHHEGCPVAPPTPPAIAALKGLGIPLEKTHE